MLYLLVYLYFRISFYSNFSLLTNEDTRWRGETFSIKAPRSFSKSEPSVIQCHKSFEPTELYKLWNSRSNNITENLQEDAEEFLSYILNKINDEMLEVFIYIQLIYIYLYNTFYI